MTDQNKILNLYALLWKNRSYDSFELMEKSILSELNDENTHPRLRRSPEVKFQLTSRMIAESNLDLYEQQVLQDYINSLFQQNFNK